MSDLLSSKQGKNPVPYSRPMTPEQGHRVGIYGLGAIGYHVARNLANSLSGPPLFVYNRTASKSEKLAHELGPKKISVAGSPAELVESCDVMYALFASKPTGVLTCLYQLYNSCKRRGSQVCIQTVLSGSSGISLVSWVPHPISCQTARLHRQMARLHRRRPRSSLNPALYVFPLSPFAFELISTRFIPQ